ncbi:MAG TPA: type II toxin-antitoxin system RelE/ParE family toxin [Armatimonadota bacterium]|nr:type II toxin-antitoxin system RelE/ParE family toxin [Armatimonadota bacterium]
MIRTFADTETERIFRGETSRRLPQEIQRTAHRKLQQLDSISHVDELRVPPGNRLHLLSGNRAGQWAISVNDQYRICFRWEDDAYEVEITDYH